MKLNAFGVNIYIPFYSVCIVSVVLILDSSFQVFSCLVAALIHEMGHLFAMILCGVTVQSIKLRAFDIVIQSSSFSGIKRDMFITLSGPLFNILFASAVYPFSSLLGYCNLAIGIFNLLPIKTFDGGHALHLVLQKKFSLNICSTVERIITFVFLLPFFYFGIMMLFYSKYNYSLLLIAVYLTAVVFMK